MDDFHLSKSLHNAEQIPNSHRTEHSKKSKRKKTEPNSVDVAVDANMTSGNVTSSLSKSSSWFSSEEREGESTDGFVEGNFERCPKKRDRGYTGTMLSSNLAEDPHLGSDVLPPTKQATKRKTKNKKERKKKVARLDEDEGAPSEDWQHTDDAENSDIDEIEGFMYEGSLLLRDKKSDAIYSCERTESGDLIRVGSWSDSGKHVFTSYLWKIAGLSSTTEKKPLNFIVTDPSDHCETAIKAYLDVKQALVETALQMGLEDPADLRVWDPFFCTGRMRIHMITIGFPRIHNENEDFYRVRHSPPIFDVLVTNPPYSHDHIPNLLQFCKSSPRPCFLLLPSYVGKKDYFEKFDDKESRYFFIVPKSGRYTYHNPGLGGAKVGRTAPFQSFWYVAGKEYRSELLRKLSSSQSSSEVPWELYKSINRIPGRFFDECDG